MRSKLNGMAVDLYRDLRDRRLLVVAIALIAGMVAVPLLIRGEEVPEPGASSVPTNLDAASELEPVVMAEAETLRKQSRLGGLQSRNPFKQQLIPTARPAAGSGGGGGGGGLPTQESVEETVASGAASVSSVETVTTGSGSAADPPIDSGGDDRKSGGKLAIASFTVDVRVGPQGDTRVVRDVEQGDRLPGKNRPVLQYLDAEFDESAASFAVSRDVIRATGEGRCAPNRAACNFLELGVGEEQELQLESTGAAYRIKLLAVDRHVRPAPARSAEDE